MEGEPDKKKVSFSPQVVSFYYKNSEELKNYRKEYCTTVAVDRHRFLLRIKNTDCLLKPVFEKNGEAV